jgi:hypothetical protein
VKQAGVAAGVAAILFFCYWRQSQSVPVTSDGAGNVLQAWDMLHGNLLLRHWWVSDVSFYTTELPQYMLIEVLFGLGAQVVHVAAAMTYTLLVLLAALLAKGRAQGRAGLARALLAGGIMLAPQLNATTILLLSPDHTGTSVPLLVIWLLIDGVSSVAPGGRPPGTPRTGGISSPQTPRRREPSPRTPLGRPLGVPRLRWAVPVLVGVGFLWTMVADSDVLLTGIVPLVLVCAWRACPGLIRGGERPAPRWYELSLAAAAAVAGVAGSLAPRVISALGGYQESHIGTDTDFSQLQHNAWVTFQALPDLLGANVFATPTTPVLEYVFVALHLAGAIVVIWALGIAARRFFRFGELIIPVFAVAIVFNLGAYLVSPHARDLEGAREIAAILPLSAVLAGRTLGMRIFGQRALGQQAKAWFAPALAVVMAAYLGAFGYGAAQAAVPPANEALATWLIMHRLSDGLAGYWLADSTTVDTRGRVVLSAVTLGHGGQLVPYQWETDDANYNPSRHDANFVVTDGPDSLPGLQQAAVVAFGQPRRTYHTGGYTVMVWNTNLLTKLGATIARP